MADELQKEGTWLIVQQGGSTAEWYGFAFDTKEQAEHGIKDTKKHTYDAIGPYQLPPGLTPEQEVALLDVFAEVASDAIMQNFSELEPDEDDSSGEDPVCDECGESYPPNGIPTISHFHKESCSLHPNNVKGKS